jgi:arabinan endo-1,5-alpha-L-arabinosidase
MNPVFPHDAPDPAVLRAADGSFYAYTTANGKTSFPVLHSSDLVHWERDGDAFGATGGPAWIDTNRWAPDVHQTGDHYTMLYSGRGADGRMRIGYATSAVPQGPFQDRGVLLEGASSGYFIDPNLVQVGDTWKLYYGSTGGADARNQDGISEVDVDIAADGTLTPRGASTVVLPEGNSRALVEGSWMQDHDGQYYLF